MVVACSALGGAATASGEVVALPHAYLGAVAAFQRLKWGWGGGGGRVAAQQQQQQQEQQWQQQQWYQQQQRHCSNTPIS